jgi:hypothetical protein
LGIAWYQNWIFENLGLFGGICTRVLGDRIWRGVARRFRVVPLALREFPSTFLPIHLNGRIARQFHQVFSPRAIILSPPIANGAKFNLI